ncbi:MAG: alpha/beta fold hydrolase [Acidimicrobiales bacterium]
MLDFPAHHPVLHVPGGGGVDIATHCLGGAGPPLLLLHATGFCGPMWFPLSAQLSDSFTLWAPDHRGHGSSGKAPDGRYDDWNLFVDDTLAVVDALGGIPLSVVGHSIGGAVALLAEQRRPGTFAQIFCYEPIVFPPMPPSANRLGELARKRRATFASRAAARANYAAKPPFSRFAPAALDAYVAFGLVELPDATVTLACAREDEASVYDGATSHDAFHRLGEIAAPVTLVGGGDSGDVPPSLLERQGAQLVRAGRVHTEVFADLTHFGPFEDPDRVGRSIARAFGGGPP